jgi:CheY-like chemotaxis protein
MGDYVLVVDDDAGIQEMLEAALQDEGYRVVIARDGIEALEQIKQDIPAVILLDVMMPRMNGFEFAEKLKHDEHIPQIPIIVLTADGHAAQKAARIGATDWLEKPLDYDRLLDCVYSYTSHSD